MKKVWSQFKNITAVFSDKKDKNLSFTVADKFDDVILNRENFLSCSGLKLNDLIMAEQPHENVVVEVFATDKGRGAYAKNSIQGADALICREKNIILGVRTADCLPIFFYEPKKKIIGAAHFGWRCIKKDLLLNIVKFLKNNYNTMMADFYVCVGPHIQKCCFEVKEDLLKEFAGYQDCFEFKKDKIVLDLFKVLSSQLDELGFDQGKIIASSQCTCCSEKYFSYRKSKQNLHGQMLSIISQK